MNAIEKLEQLVADLKKNANAFYDKGNKSAGTRLRKNAQDVKNLCTEIRKEVLENRK